MHLRPSLNAKTLLADIPAYQFEKFPRYLGMDLIFGDHVLGMQETALSSGAYWSMCFEVHYYVLFATAFYLRGLTGIALLLLAVPVIGLGPMLHFPRWLPGAMVYWLDRRQVGISRTNARALFAVTVALMAVDLATNLNLRIDGWLDV
ncbi:MAG: hypothetical protein ACREFO_01920 [Acetobacteraceae bacterium]